MNFVKAFQCVHLTLKGIQILGCGVANLHSGTYIRNIKINLDIFIPKIKSTLKTPIQVNGAKILQQ